MELLHLNGKGTLIMS